MCVTGRRRSDGRRPVAGARTDIDDLIAALDFSVLGPFTASRHVLDGMRSLGSGTVILVNGGTAVRAKAGFAGTSVAFAGEGALAQILHDTLREENIHVAQLIVPGRISPDSPDTSPSVIADTIWDLHNGRGGFRYFLTPMETDHA